MNRADAFSKEVALIVDLSIRDWVYATLNKVPTYFYTAAASSTGKYHPACSNQKPGGLQIHVKRALYFAENLCKANQLSAKERDIVLASVILHDIAKCESYGNFKQFEDHPINATKYFAGGEAISEVLPTITNCIAFHMGPWTPASIRKPMQQYTLLEFIVYTSDYMSSIKDLVTPVDTEKPYAA